ncbi:metal-dependent hydrolase family protein [Roseovarius pelagicus]|uniref:Amidohydrolase family protein n=1 Tax=Roseovarius pelagicus TaxID=2980108 RepID=A0ABY6DCG5_9RHOB|nr:amidohydrolase family protein [Roseovarius pelagicus]UXX81530.1 amidohydrolase family protein [Roseovarius pelagicus]
MFENAHRRRNFANPCTSREQIGVGPYMSGNMQETIITNVALWRGKNAEIEPNMSIRVRGDRIADVAPAGDLQPSVNEKVVDGQGTTAIPGMIDAHVHLTTNSDYSKVVDNSMYRALVPGTEKLLHGVRNGLRALAAGFTTLRVMGHRESGDVELASMIDRGLLPGPRLLVAPWVISMTGGRGDLFYPAALPRQPLDTADGVEECRKLVRLQRKLGAGFIKVTASAGYLSADDKVHWPNYTVDELKVIVSEAHDYDLKVAAHAHSPEGIKRALLAGVDTIEHGTNITDELIQMMVDQGAYLVPTLAIGDSIARRGSKSGVPAQGLEKMQGDNDSSGQYVRRAKDAGVKIVMGTDSSGNLCEFGEHARELELYVKLGMSPAEALLTTTSVAAEALGMEDEIGTVETGKYADIVLVNGNPLNDIGLLNREGGLRAVFKSGIDVTNPWPAIF